MKEFALAASLVALLSQWAGQRPEVAAEEPIVLDAEGQLWEPPEVIDIEMMSSAELRAALSVKRPEDQVTDLKLEDGELVVTRLGGQWCGMTCSVIGHSAEDHCQPYREIYGAVCDSDGESLVCRVELVETIYPEIIPAQPEKVIWP